MPRAIRFHRFGGPEVLRIEEIPSPQPGPDEVRIRVKALGLNRAESLIRRNTYITTPTLPSGLGLEAAGIVDRVGEAVKGFNPGDAVSVIPSSSMVRWSAYGEEAVFPAKLVVKHPQELSWETAAALWMAYVTAYGALIEVAGLRRGDTVAITAASSSVGLAAIQIANALGAKPIAVTSSPAKAAALQAAGAAHVVLSGDGDLTATLVAAAAPGGVRVVFDAVAGPLFEPLTAAMAPSGILIEYGGLSDRPTPFPLPAVLGKQLTLRGYLMHAVTADEDQLARAKRFILEGLAAGWLTPVIDRVFPFEQIVEAHRHLESNTQFGKIVVTL